MTTRDLVIEQVTVIDGTGTPGFVADVGIRGDRIVSIDEPGAGAGTGAASATTRASAPTIRARIDGRDLVLAPGFVDVHSHDDTAVLVDPTLSCKTLQGVTSVVVGNCGISAAPISEHTPGVTVYERMEHYHQAIDDQGAAVNVGALIGHGAIRAAVMGLKTAREASAAELSAMADHVAGAMEDGALGLSSGLAYEPGCYATPGELVELNRLVAGAGAIYTTHMRDEGTGLLASIDESIAVAEATGVPLQISHLKASGRDSWGSVGLALERIDRARSAGLDVMADQYPYTRGSTLLEQIIVAGALDGPSGFGHVTPAEVLVAASPGHPEWEGRTVAQIAESEGVDGRRMADLIVEAEGRRCMVVIDTMAEDDVRTVMGHEAVMVGTDGLPLGQKPHPRLHHTYPRILGHYVREEGLLDLPDAIRRMTSTPARRFGFTDRGEIRVGAFADLVLLDPARILDTGTWSHPTRVPTGVLGVWVNGVRVVDDGVVTGARPGRVNRRI